MITSLPGEMYTDDNGDNRGDKERITTNIRVACPFALVIIVFFFFRLFESII